MQEEKWIDYEKRTRKLISENSAQLVFFRDGNLVRRTGDRWFLKKAIISARKKRSTQTKCHSPEFSQIFGNTYE